MTLRQINPLPKQDEAWQAFKDDNITDILYGGAAGGGKSYTACQMATVCCYELPGCTIGLARKELTTLMKTTYMTLLEVFEGLGIPPDDWKLNGQYNWVDFTNGSRILLLDTAYKPTDPNYDRFGGLLLTHAFGEELPEWNEKAWQILQTRIGRNNTFNINGVDVEVVGKFLGTCNPNQNWVKRIYYDPWKNGSLPSHRVFIPAFAHENTYLPGSYLKQLDNIADEVTRKRLRDGEWDYQDEEGVLMQLDYINDVFTNTIIKDGQKYLTVDVARFGGDTIVYNRWEGLESVERIYKTKQGIDQTAQDVRDLAAVHQIPFSNIIVDEDGVGGGVVDLLRGVKGFVNNSTPLSAKTVRAQVRPHIGAQDGRSVVNFSNLKSQCGFMLAELVTDHKLAIKNADGMVQLGNESIPERDAILQEFSWIKQYKPDQEGKLRIYPKDIVKEQIGRSPDVGDTFIMRAWFEVNKTSRLGELPTTGLTARHHNRPKVMPNKGI